jgi:hypothetical protein
MMGVRNFLILFFAAMAISLVILVVFFSLFFKNIDLNFNTKMPESAPNPLQEKAQPVIKSIPSNHDHFKADGVQRATVNVPSDKAPATSPNLSPSITGNNNSVGIGVNTDAPVPDTKVSPKSTATKTDTTLTPSNPTTPNTGDPAVSREATSPPASPSGGVQTSPSPPAPRAPKPHIRPYTPPTDPTSPSPRQQLAPTVAPTPDNNTPPTQEEPPVPTGTIPSQQHQVYLDHFTTPEQAQATAEKLKAQGIEALVRLNQHRRPVVQIGTFNNLNNAEQIASKTGAKLRTLP